MSETTVKTIKTQTSIFDLDTFDSVLVGKETTFTPATSYAEALARLGGDESKLLETINSGLEDSARNELRTNPEIPWKTFDEEGNPSADFSGTAADEEKVNALRNQLARSIFNYSADMKPEEKKAAKAAAMDMIKNTQSIRDGLVKSMQSGK